MKTKSTLTITIGAILIMLFIANCNTYGQRQSHDANVFTYKGIESKSNSLDIASPKERGVTYMDGTVAVTEMLEGYTFPFSIDETKSKVVIGLFGSPDSYYWSKNTGLVFMEGDGRAVCSSGIVAGIFFNSNMPSGPDADAAGLWDENTQEWVFIGMNPEYPSSNADYYNGAWGMSNDGNVLAGLQWVDGWDVRAFKWTIEDGYNTVGNLLPNGSRANGVSGNGEVVYGWSSSDIGEWLPTIWYDDTYSILANEDGEVLSSSADGTIFGGHFSSGTAYYWTENEGIVSFGGDDYPTTILSDGSIFGFSGLYPVYRTAFYRDPQGNMTSFNDYAESRGMEDAQSWFFYSVNDATSNGDAFIGAGINPQGEDVSFIIDFNPPQIYSLTLNTNPSEGGVATGSGDYESGSEVTIAATANENYKFINWTNSDGDILSTDSITLFTMPEANTELVANFQSTENIQQTEFDNMSIYPNPAADFINIEMIPENSEIVLTNLFGEEIVRSSSLSNTTTRINTSNLQSGVYFLIIKTGNNYKTHKIHIIK